MARLLIVGCGYVGSALAERRVRAGDTVFGMRREVADLPDGVTSLRGDVSVSGGLGALPPNLDYVVYAVGAKARDEASYRRAYLDGIGNLLDALGDEAQSPKRILFTSSTSVYAQSRGEWLDEESPTHPQRFSGQIMLSAEGLLRGSRYPSVAVRLGGIYGPGRTSMLEAVRSGQPTPTTEQPHFTNRIHRDDAAGILEHLMGVIDPAPVYIGVDDEPAPRDEVVSWLSSALGIRDPGRAPAGKARTGSKRCSNALIRASGYVFLHPNYRHGYSDLIGVAV
jgi:nucleoside-diphosphate-sugar epimerase